MLLGWRRLASTPAEKLLTETSIRAVLDDLGLARNDGGASDLTDDVRQLAATDGTVGMMTGAIGMAERHGLGRALGAWRAAGATAGLGTRGAAAGPRGSLGHRRSPASIGSQLWGDKH
jgi:hypothetical protein